MMNIDEIIKLVEQEAPSIIRHGRRKVEDDEFRCSLIFTEDGVKYILFIKVKQKTVKFQYGYSVEEQNGAGKEYWNMGDYRTETMMGAEVCKDNADMELENIDMNELACHLYMDTPAEVFFLNRKTIVEPDWKRA